MTGPRSHSGTGVWRQVSGILPQPLCLHSLQHHLPFLPWGLEVPGEGSGERTAVSEESEAGPAGFPKALRTEGPVRLSRAGGGRVEKHTRLSVLKEAACADPPGTSTSQSSA